MNWRKKNLFLAGAFTFLVGIIVVMSVQGIRVTRQFHDLFRQTYEDPFTEIVTMEQAHANLIAVHRGMKDLVLSRTPQQMAAALAEVEKYDGLVRQNISELSSIHTEDNAVEYIAAAYAAWQPIRSRVMDLVRQGQYDQAAEVTRTAGAEQVVLITYLMDNLVRAERAEAATAYDAARSLAEKGGRQIALAAPLQILAAVFISVITYRKLRSYEKQLHKEKEELQTTLDSIGDGVITTDTRGRVLRLNRMAQAYTGWTNDEACGRPFAEVFDIVNSVSGQPAKDPVQEVLCTDEICQLENHTILTARDGAQLHIADSAAPIRNLHGQTEGVVMIFRDVTERRLFQEKLRQSEEHYRMLFNTMLNGYALHEMVFDQQGRPCDYRFVDVNPAFSAMTGLAKEDCLGRTVRELLPTTESSWLDQYGQVVLTGQPVEFDDYSAALGKYYHVFAFRPIENHFAVLVSDITAQHQLEDSIREREERFASLFDYMASGAAVYRVQNDGAGGRDYQVREINQAGLAMSGLSREKVLGKTLAQLQPKIDDCGLIPVMRAVWLSGRPASLLSHEISAAGADRWYDYRISRLSTGEIVAIYADVSERTALYEKLRQSEETYRLLVEHQNDLVVKIDRYGCYHYVSPSFCRLMGKSEAELLGTPYLVNVYAADISASNKAVAALRQPPHTYQFEERLITGQGIRWIEWDSSGVIDGEGSLAAIIDTGRDITERKKSQEQVVYLNYHDVLTGLYNRKFFEEETRRLDTERQLPVSVIWGDINGLKLINDGFGHQQGDRVLVQIGSILRRCCRDEDIVARIGGDEFCILLPQTDSDAVQEICRRIQLACEQCRQEAGEEWIYPSIALGYGTKTSAEENLDSILKNAEAFMYRRKLLESKSMYSSLISAIKTTMVEKSHETEAHAERLVWLSKAMGSQLGLPEEQMNELALFATLHDIGKIGIDDRILNKAGRLNEAEWLEMKRHPEVGYRIAMASPELVSVAQYILCHHEHWDGSGYPQGLQGREIPLLARILTIVDAFDAMTQDRPYRQAVPWQTALREINLHAGSQFDPELARIFVEMVLIQAASQPIAG